MPGVFHEVLKHYPDFVQPVNEPVDLGNAGGLSGAKFWRYPSSLGELVLKRWPNPGPSVMTLRRNHEWLRRCAGLRFVPQPIPADRGETFLDLDGRLWELQPWMRGSPPSANPALPAEVELAFEALARLHDQWAIESKKGPSPSLAARRDEVEGWMTRGFAMLERLAAERSADPATDLVRHWVSQARVFAPEIALLLNSVVKRPLRLQPCVKDLRREHWLFAAGRVSGLIDFGAMDRDCVATDLSRLVSDWLGDDPVWKELALRAYATIRPLDAVEMEMIDVFEQSADLLVGGHWARWLLLDPREFDDPEAISRGLAHGLERVSRLGRGRVSLRFS